MALIPAVAAAQIWEYYRDAASIDSDGNPVQQPPTGDFPSNWAAAYDNYASAGVVPGAINQGGDKSILENFLRGLVSRDNVNEFATALASYWATVAIIPGAPAHGGTSVASVTNDAASKVSFFEAAILASITANRTEPFFQHLILNIQSIAVSQIIWYVTENTLDGPITFPESIV